MTQIIDFRNAKYQGQIHNSLPNGLGIMIDYKNIFCLAEWQNGLIEGKCIIIFGDSKIFYGQIKNQNPYTICTYHLKDKCQVFCNFENDIKNSHGQTNQQIPNSKTNKLVALLPTFNMIINVEGQSQQHLQIIGQQVYRDGDTTSLQNILQKMLNWRFMQNQLNSFLSLQNFLAQNFQTKPHYRNLLDILQTLTPQGAKQIFITMKTSPKGSSLGIKIQNCMDNPTHLTNRHNDGNSYIVKASGFFSKQGILQYGLKNIKTLIKGNVKQEAIYNDQKTITRYEDENNRPVQCSINILNHLKKSLNFENYYLPIRYFQILQAQCLNINFNIKQTQTKKFAQLVLQNPRELTMQQKQQIQDGRIRRLKKGSIQKNTKDQLSNPYKKTIQQYSKKNEALEKVKQDIYRSISKKKINGPSSSPYVHAGTNLSSSPEKQIKPSQLTNVKPILQIYKNTADKSFYNSINLNDRSNLDSKSNEGYKFNVKTQQNENNKNQQYFKNLEDRKRLYQQNDISKSPISKQGTQYNDTNERHAGRKKFSYLPEEDKQPYHQQANTKSYQKNNSFSRLNESSDNHLKSYGQDSYENGRTSDYIKPGQSAYDPHNHYHNHFNSKTLDQEYFKSRRTSPHIDKSSERANDQTGKLGKRTIRKQADDLYSNNQSSSIHRKAYSRNQPIIVPEFKVNHTNAASDYKKPSYEEYSGPTPKRQHHLKYDELESTNKSPLRSQQYRKQYLEQTSPIKKVHALRNTPEKYKYQYDVIMDPAVNFAKQDLNRNYSAQRGVKYFQEEENSLSNQQYARSKSPLPKRKKILHDNPFQN